ncbi:pentapeptide repeat-containing protein [Photobacterium sp. ZSDE20]|uniref:Pentapeptide repeat-containing protein n=1 Tax=Photobacterium pectinilyticum TaxID=2906793 RepID=A0ABT1N9B4_9GAMM|nr:pentapeptide repeat-containing protein [Photobacterium sp. ZSDE20]MCQ1061142.1 pentapeptide repeat-containing protein [Photobacterium sp. ZSDE20]MDD1829393.1 pentapeptide repeat-containing protein [Photobacterium sp. ZSDE20]
MDIKKVRWLLWDLSGCRYVWNKVRPEKDNGQPEPSSVVFWILSIYIALFSLTSAVYEVNKGSYDAKVSQVYTLLQMDDLKQLGKNKITVLQGSHILVKPDFYNPIANIKSLLRITELDADSEIELKNLLKHYRSELDNSYLYKGNFSEISDLSNANFQNSNLINADFSGSNLIGTNFSDADLKGAKFTGADLSFATFCRTDLRDTDLSEAVGLDSETLSCAYSLYEAKIPSDVEDEIINSGRLGLLSAIKVN